MKAIKIICVETGKVYNSIAAAARDTGLDAANISAVIRGKRQSVGADKLHFTRVDDNV